MGRGKHTGAPGSTRIAWVHRGGDQGPTGFATDGDSIMESASGPGAWRPAGRVVDLRRGWAGWYRQRQGHAGPDQVQLTVVTELQVATLIGKGVGRAPAVGVDREPMAAVTDGEGEAVQSVGQPRREDQRAGVVADAAEAGDQRRSRRRPATPCAGRRGCCARGRAGP